MKRIMVMFAVLAFVLSAAGVGQAKTLSDLFSGESITAGDKLFDQWSLSRFLSSDQNRSFDDANIEVTALADNGSGPGLSFDVSNRELFVTGDDLYAYVDLMFGFRVSVLDPGFRIKDNSLILTGGSVTQSGDNGSYINETIGTAAGASDLGTKKVEFSWLDQSLGGPGLISNTSDSAVFAPQSEIWVTKNILVWATGLDETANLWSFEQRFSQEPVGTPEPGTLLLLAGGLASLFAGRRMFGRHDG